MTERSEISLVLKVASGCSVVVGLFLALEALIVFGIWNFGRAIVLGSAVLQLFLLVFAKANEWDRPTAARRAYLLCFMLPAVAFAAAALSHEL